MHFVRRRMLKPFVISLVFTHGFYFFSSVFILVFLLTSAMAAPTNHDRKSKFLPYMMPQTFGPIVDHKMPGKITNFDSPIYYIKLPPMPYSFVPGLGYMPLDHRTSNPVNLPINFLSNGKPTTVYRYLSTKQY